MPLLILIGGGSGAGKTYISQHLRTILGNCRILKLDDYYLDSKDSVNTNFDHPKQFDWKLLNNQLKELKQGNRILKPIYSYALHSRIDEEYFESADIILLEGIYALYDPEILKIAGVKVYVDAKENIRLARRVKRDINERERSSISVREQFKKTVRPMHKKYVEKTKKNADFVIINDSKPNIRPVLDRITEIFAQKLKFE